MGTESGSGAGEDTQSAAAFRTALRNRGMTLVALRDRLHSHGNPVSLTTLSYWRSGRRHPEGAVSLAAIADIESVLGLDDDELMRRLRPSRRLGAVDPQRTVGEESLRRAFDECIAELVPGPPPDLRDLSTHIVADVDDAGDLRHIRNQAVIQCISGTLAEIPYFEVATAPTDAALEFTTLSACRVARTHRHAGGRVTGVVFELERALDPSDTVAIEWELTFPADYPPARVLEHAVDRRSRELLLMARFSPNAPPSWCEEFEDDENGLPVLARRLSVRSTAHVVRHSFGPGSVGLTWGYGE